MHGIFGAAAVAFAALLADVALAAQPHAASAAPTTIRIENAWVPQPPPGTEVAAAYFTVRNVGHDPAVLLEVTSPLASEAMLHETRIVGGESRMRMLERLAIPAGGAVTLTPGAIHVMLVGLHQVLRVGQQVPLVLRFENGQQIRILAPVRASAAGG
ncbi:MAG TPA: copper chaperone PCu(A)C [Steroidobacteraceae bacterium]|nr:copper chaperone PCu(A)C [Steroidobacteraceae bacterium]